MASESRQGARVLQVIRPAVGGMKHHMLQLAVGLAAYGFQTEVACPGEADIVHDALELNVPVHPVPIVGPLNPVRDPFAIWALASVIRERKPDLVHAHGYKAGLIARLAARFSGKPPVVVTIHNPVLYRKTSAFARWWQVAIERALAPWTARIITVSEALRHELVDGYGIEASLVTTVHDGLDLSPFLVAQDRGAMRARHGVPSDALVFGSAGRFAPDKGQDVLVEAAIPVLERHSNAWLILAGDGPLLETVKTRARKARQRDRILFPGWETDVPGLLGALDVYVSATLAEGLGLGAIEAMAAGLPVVSTRAGGTPEVVQNGVTGLLVPPGDARGLTDAMFAVARDVHLRRRLGDAGRERALAEFTQERMFERTAAVYREVLA